MPPPSVSPAIPVVEMMPPVVASPNACVAWLKSPHVTPPSARAVRVRGSTLMPRIGDRSMTVPPSFVPKPGALCDPPRTDTSPPRSRPNRTAAITSPGFAQRTTTAGIRSCIALYTFRASS